MIVNPIDMAHLWLRPRNLSGQESTIVVTTVSKTVNWVPSPSVSNITKNKIDQKGANGSLDTASG